MHHKNTALNRVTAIKAPYRFATIFVSSAVYVSVAAHWHFYAIKEGIQRDYTRLKILIVKHGR